jgi:fluoride exporter
MPTNASHTEGAKKPSPVIFPIMFLGGALGASLRYAIELGLQGFASPQLIATAVVNLVGALLLGFVNFYPWFKTLNRKLFFGHGLLGGFTTMSGLAVIAASADLGLGESWYWYWLFVTLQLGLGVLLYAVGIELAKRVSK